MNCKRTSGPLKLSDHRDERVVLLFYPGDNTVVYTKQFCSYRDRAEDFASLQATVVGISSQDLASHEQFTTKHGLNVPLLADVDKAVAKSYSAVMPGLGSTARAVIVIDEQGVVRDPPALAGPRSPSGGRAARVLQRLPVGPG